VEQWSNEMDVNKWNLSVSTAELGHENATHKIAHKFLKSLNFNLRDVLKSEMDFSVVSQKVLIR
jgi:hypothetical protein